MSKQVITGRDALVVRKLSESLEEFIGISLGSNPFIQNCIFQGLESIMDEMADCFENANNRAREYIFLDMESSMILSNDWESSVFIVMASYFMTMNTTNVDSSFDTMRMNTDILATYCEGYSPAEKVWI